MGAQSGSSTVECLVALVVFTIGALGAAGTTALALRLETTADRIGEAALLGREVVDREYATVRWSGGRCRPGGGALAGPRGTGASWTGIAAGRGIDLRIRLTWPSAAGPRTDSLHAFVWCRP